MSVRKISEIDDTPSEGAIYLWPSKNEEFSDKYERAVQLRTSKYMEECVDLADSKTDGIMFLGLGGRLYERVDVLQLRAQERAMAGLVPIEMTTELVNKRKLQIETRLKAAARMHPRKYGDRTVLAGDSEAPVVVKQDLSAVSDEVVLAVTKALKESGVA